jgi:hypothetical protein
MIDGSENGPRTIEIGNWSGKAIYSPRAKLIDLLKEMNLKNLVYMFLNLIH